MVDDSIIYRWIYLSRHSLTPATLDPVVSDIVEASLARNRELGVTGALICCETRFLQYLEGEMSSVMTVKSSICRDYRHAQVTTLIEGAADRQLFVDWSLLYVRSSRYLKTLLSGLVLGSDEQEQHELDKVTAIFSELSMRRTRDNRPAERERHVLPDGHKSD